MRQSSLMENALRASTREDFVEAFSKIAEGMDWRSEPSDIPWRDADNAQEKMAEAIKSGEAVPLWRAHRSWNPYEGLGGDWSHGSPYAFAASEGEAGMGFGQGSLPAGVSFLTKFEDKLGDDRPMLSDFGLEWLAHEEGSVAHRSQAAELAQSLGEIRGKARSGAEISVNELYETPLSPASASIEATFLARVGPRGARQMSDMPDTAEWRELAQKALSFEVGATPAPRNFGMMPPAAARGEKCANEQEILAKVQALGKGAPLSKMGLEAAEEEAALSTARQSLGNLRVEAAGAAFIALAENGGVARPIARLSAAEAKEAWKLVQEALSPREQELLLGDRPVELRQALGMAPWADKAKPATPAWTAAIPDPDDDFAPAAKGAKAAKFMDDDGIPDPSPEAKPRSLAWAVDAAALDASATLPSTAVISRGKLAEWRNSRPSTEIAAPAVNHESRAPKA